MMFSRTTSRPLALSLELLRPHRLRLAGAGGLLLAQSAATLALPLLAGRLADALLGESAAWSVTAVASMLLAALAAQTVAGIIGNLSVAHIGDDMLRVLRCRVFDRLIRLPMVDHEHRARGDQLSLLTTDAQAVSAFLSGTLPGLMPAGITCLGALALMASIQPVLAMVVVVAVPPCVIVLRLWMRVVRRRARALHDAHGANVSVAEQAIELLPVIKAEAREGRQSSAYAASAQTVLQQARRLRYALSPLRPGIQFLSTVGIVGLVVLAAPGLARGTLTPGDLVTLILYGMFIARSLAALADAYARWNGAQGALSRLLEAVDAPREPNDGSKRHVPRRLSRGITWDGIRFGYDPAQPIFSDFNLSVGSGECIALTGPNGCGKSTLVWLLLRFYEPHGGRITIDGVDIRELSLPALRRAVALVPQRVWLFQGSVADNILLAWPEAGQEDIERAAEQAQALEFIRALPKGFETELGPRGARISGGQQQRLALARALIRPTPILVLDEATSMFDEAGEAEVTRTLASIKRERTTILITHRPALLKLADRRIDLDPPTMPAERDRFLEMP